MSIKSIVLLAATSVLLLLAEAVEYSPFVVPNILDGSEWGAEPANGETSKLSVSPVPIVIISQSGTLGCSTKGYCKERVQSIQRLHMDTYKWNDIGYNFLVGGDGNVYMGRGWDSTGEHTPFFNDISLGICIIGTFEDCEPPQAAIEAVKNLIAYGVTAKKISESYVVHGRRRSIVSLTPGAKLYQSMQSWPNWRSDL